MINKAYIIKALLATFAALSIFSGHAISSQNLLTEVQIRELPKSTQQFIRYQRHLINDFGYAGINAMSFKETKTNSYALSSIQKNKKHTNEPMYAATVSEGTGGMASIYFRVYRDCNLTDRNILLDKVIKVNDKRVGVLYGCSRVPEEENTQQIYMIKSDEGKAFVQQEFANNPFVFVDFDGVLIPFETDGFEEVWIDKNTPAL